MNELPSPAPAHSFFRQTKPVWATALATMVGFMSIGLVDPILTSIAAGLKATPSQVSLLFTSYFAVTAVMMLVTGVVSFRFGGRATLLLGAALPFLLVAAAACFAIVVLYFQRAHLVRAVTSAQGSATPRTVATQCSTAGWRIAH
jgi:MFS family permease